MRGDWVFIPTAILVLFVVFLSGCGKDEGTFGASGPTMETAAEKALAEAKAASMPVLLNFHSTKCKPCIEIEKVIKEVEPEYAGRAAFIIVDVYDPSEQRLCNQYDIQTIPTTAFLDADGKFVESYTGVIDANSMRGVLDSLISGQL